MSSVREIYKFRPLKEWHGFSLAISDTRAFAYQVLLCYRLAKNVHSPSFDRDDWRTRVCELMRAAPHSPCFDIHALMGVTGDWVHSPLWV